MNKMTFKHEARRYTFMVIACVVYAFSFQCFLVPSNIVAGGISGLTIVVGKYVNLKLGTITLILNIPILLICLKQMGLKFTLNCLLTTFVLSRCIDLFSYVDPIIKDDRIINAVFGGFIQGIAIGLFCKYRVSSGGTELLGRFMHNVLKFFSIPVFTAIFDGIIVITGAIVMKDVSNVFYALIVIFISSRVSDIILVGINQSKLCYIISDEAEVIGEFLIHHSPRGVTKISGIGMYTKMEKGILMTVVKGHQVQELKEIVMALDPKAFVIVSQTYEVLGNGFKLIDKDEEDNIQKALIQTKTKDAN